jgi:2-keto-4-pentenoate hydratase
MSRDELAICAGHFLSDFDALHPWHLFRPDHGMPPEQAYALQSEIVRLREDRGERVIGYKVGCISKTIQDQLGISEPIFGRIFDTGCFPAGSRLAHDRFAKLAIEGELAIRLARDLPLELVSDDEYLAAIGSIFPVIELHHYVLPEGGCALPALIASGGMHAGLVLATQETPCSGQIPGVSELEVTIDDHLAGRTSEPWTMGCPATTLRWLSARLARWGLSLRRGQVILTGSALQLFPVAGGCRVTAKARPPGQSHVAID